ncbi:hypothetical protein DH2020_013996 [Rehmannia glutinosa]|uniref:Reverse transcriptase Ty1/copia-type domain-containing protein n=1 Tax=Rehmannia glutinosa TaxID=99300 RepID=A0ABR0WWK7_REHGL
MKQPPGFVNPQFPSHVCLLKKAIYGLRQAPRAWYHEFRSFLLSVGFSNSKADSSLFIFSSGSSLIYLLIYVDDIIVTSNSSSSLQQFTRKLSVRFSLKDLGPLSYFLGIQAHRTPSGLFLSQTRYIHDILQRTNMLGANEVSTPLSPSDTLKLHDGSPSFDPTQYRQVLGSLQYLSLTRPDISFAVNKLAQFMHCPSVSHWAAVKRVLRYLKGTSHYGIFLSARSPLSLHAFADADWAGDLDTRHSTSAYVVFLGSNPISWSSKKQTTVARSSTEAEYRAIASATAEVNWLNNLLHELLVSLVTPPTIYCDNVGATYLCSNPVFHSRMKHIALDFHFVRDQVLHKKLRVSHVSSADQLADSLTKPLARKPFQLHRSKLSVLAGPLRLRGHDKASILP